MAGLARWLVAIASTLSVFGLCLWLFRFVSFSWMPHAAADRWVVAAAFATVAAGAVGAATGWWAQREHAPPDQPSTADQPSINLAENGISVGGRALNSAEGPVFGSHGDYRGATFNFQPRRAVPREPQPQGKCDSTKLPGDPESEAQDDGVHAVL
jgi:hypothetical protein